MENNTSKLSTLDQYKQELSEAGFEIINENISNAYIVRVKIIAQNDKKYNKCINSNNLLRCA